MDVGVRVLIGVKFRMMYIFLNEGLARVIEDLAVTGENCESRAADDPLVTPEALATMANFYVGDDLHNPIASPLYGDLTGLPPLLVFVGTREVLYDDAERIVDKARQAGVTATLEIGDDLVHVWPMYNMPEAVESLSQMADFVG